MKKLAAVIMLAALAMTLGTEVSAEENKKTAVYLGVKGYGSSTVNKDTKPDFEYNFFADGQEVALKVDNGSKSDDSVWTYDIQNTLQEGYVYEITLNDTGVVTAAELIEGEGALAVGTIRAASDKEVTIGTTRYDMGSQAKTWRITRSAGGAQVTADTAEPGDTAKAVINANGNVSTLFLSEICRSVVYPVSGTPGRKTVKNFLQTAFMPVGTVLYVFGGGWNWQDTYSSRFVSQIGVPESWIEFFQSQDMDYTFKSLDYATGDSMANADPAHSYYPYYGWNEYNYAGVDCSAYVAWAAYNTINTKSGKKGYLTNSKRMAGSFAGKGWGEKTTSFTKPKNSRSSDFIPGDIMSINGHVWICLGTCSDGSIVILHSTPSFSYTNMPGGGPQIGAIGDSEDCKAFRLAEEYMTTYYPEWSSRYPVTLKSYDQFANTETEGTGKFRWDTSGNGVLRDPDGYQQMSGEEVLEDLFKSDY